MWSFFWISIDPAGAAGHKKGEQMNIGKSLFLLACITCLTVSPLSAAQKGAVMTVKEGSKVTFDYVLKVDDQVVDTSEGGKPFTYTQGAGNIIPGLEKQLAGMKVGDEKTATITPEEGYGIVDPNAFQEVPKTQFPPTIPMEAGTTLQLRDNEGRGIPAKIVEVKNDTVIIDFNHPLAGKTLVFDVKITDIK